MVSDGSAAISETSSPVAATSSEVATTSSVLELVDAAALEDFVRTAADLLALDASTLRLLAEESLRHYRGRQHYVARFASLERRWYASLCDATPDFSVYYDAYLLADLWACWVIYSRHYLRSAARVGIIAELSFVRSAVDLGSGISYSTAALAQLLPRARVMCTSMTQDQRLLASLLAQRYGFEVFATTENIGAVDFVFASEYFEHFEDPIAHLHDVLRDLRQPSALLIANSFNTRSIGHFVKYKHGEREIDGKLYGRAFNDELRALGYRQVETSCWNARPAYWRL